MLIPGNMCDRRVWEPIAMLLERDGWPVECLMLPTEPSIVRMARAVLAEAPAQMILVGFSMGAIVALEMASVAPARIVGLGLVAVNAAADLPERAAARPQQQKEVRDGRLRQVMAEQLVPNYFAPLNAGRADLIDLTIDMGLDLGPDVFVAQSEALRTRDDLYPALARLTVPVFLACGAEDQLCPPAWHRRWAEAIGDAATVREIDAAGHMLPIEHPDALSAALSGWLATAFNSKEQ